METKNFIRKKYKTMSLLNTIKTKQEEFEDVFITGGWVDGDANDITSHITSTIISLLEAQIEELEGRRMSEKYTSVTSSGAPALNVGYNQALEETITTYKELIKQIQ